MTLTDSITSSVLMSANLAGPDEGVSLSALGQTTQRLTFCNNEPQNE